MDWTITATIVTALATLVLAVITGYYAWLTRSLVRVHKEPHVVVLPNPGPFGGDWIDLVLINLGGGPAYDIRVTPSRELRRFTYDCEDSIRVDAGPFVHGVGSLPANALRTLPWGPVSKVRNFLGEKALTVDVEFAASPGAKRGRRRTRNPIEVGSLDGIRIHEVPLYSMALSLQLLVEQQAQFLALVKRNQPAEAATGESRGINEQGGDT